MPSPCPQHLANTPTWHSPPQAIHLLDELFSGNHWLYVSALHNMALAYVEQGELVKGKEVLDKVGAGGGCACMCV